MTPPLKLKIALQELSYKCERTLLVPENINMRQLHFIIQEYFGWFNAQLFESCDTKLLPAIRVDVLDDFIDTVSKQDIHKVKLKETFLEENNAKAFGYWHDFGDDRWHGVSSQKLAQKALKLHQDIPLCIYAQGKCPPKDVGGTWGYTKFLEVIIDKDHPEHKKIRECYGLEENEEYDGADVNMEKINLLLSESYQSEDWNLNSYDSFKVSKETYPYNKEKYDYNHTKITNLPY